MKSFLIVGLGVKVHGIASKSAEFTPADTCIFVKEQVCDLPLPAAKEEPETRRRGTSGIGNVWPKIHCALA